MIEYVPKSELEHEQVLHKLTGGALIESNLSLADSQRNVAKLEGEKRELLAEIKRLQSIIDTLTDTPY